MNVAKKIVLFIGITVEGCMKAAKGLWKGYWKSIIPKRQEKSLVLIANGPSLNATQIEFFSEEVEYACVNFFAGHDERFVKLQPSYLCLFDPVFWNTNVPIELKLKLEKTYDTLEKVDWELTVISCIKAKLPVKNTHITYKYITPFQLVYDENKRLRHYLYRHNLVNPGIQNVVSGALYYFINAGYKMIYLAGADMNEFKNYYIDRNNNILLERKHSYTEDNEKVNYLKYGIVKKGEFHVLLGKYCKMLKEFHLISEYAKSQRAIILNLNPDSYIDVFEKTEDYCIKYERGL